MNATLSQSTDTYRLSRRTVFIPGDRFRVGKGPLFKGRRCAVRGEFEFIGAVQRGARIFIDAVQIQAGQRGGRFLLYASGRPFRHPKIPGLMMRPYVLKKLRQRGAA